MIKLNDYSKGIILKGNEVAREVLRKVAENADIFISDNLEPTDEERLELETKMAVLGNEIVKMMTEKGIKLHFATRSVESIVEGFDGLSKFVGGTIRNWEDEYISRAYGAKNPEGKFRREEMLLGDFLIKLNEVREATGGNSSDFYNDTPPEGSEVSPYAGEALADK